MNWLILAWAVVAAILALELYGYRKLRKLHAFMRNSLRLRQAESSALQGDDAQRMALLRRQVELSFLQHQINPHFLYNTLDSIRSRALMDRQREIAKMTEILARFFRYCISRDDSMVRVGEELDHIRDYFYIQKFRFEDRFDMEIDVERDELLELFLPRMTIQPLVENAMIHGLEKVEHKGLIRVSLMAAGDRLCITVSDNGFGMPREELLRLNERLAGPLEAEATAGQAQGGIAIRNVNTRLRLMFGEDSGIRYRSLIGEGTDAVVTMPAVDVFSRARYENQFGA